MRDIVIPYVKNQSGELKACINLIEKNVPHRNIYVIEEFKESQYSHISHINQILKLKWAIENIDLTEEFYLFNDDFFVLDPVEDIPYMHRGPLEKHIAARRGRGVYTNALRATEEWLKYTFDKPLSYETHVPFLFNKHILAISIATLERGIESGKCPLIRSWYGNCAQVGGIEIEDVKNIQNYETSTYLSTTEQSFYRRYGNFIRSKI